MSRSLARRAIKRFGGTLGGLAPARARELRPAEPPGGGGLATLDRGTCLLLVTHRRDGRAVPTPLWFVRDGERALVRTSADSPKVARARRDRDPLAAPCDHRGRPLGAGAAGGGAPARRARRRGGAARIADARITSRYGLRGRVWGALLRYARLEAAYLELRARGELEGGSAETVVRSTSIFDVNHTTDRR